MAPRAALILPIGHFVVSRVVFSVSRNLLNAAEALGLTGGLWCGLCRGLGGARLDMDTVRFRLS